MQTDDCVYILLSPNSGKHYTGFTSDLINRFHSHNQYSKSGFTNRYRPWVVIHVEIFDNKNEAMQREKWLKTGTGRDYVKSLSK
jgi:putative endonuclease